MNLKRILIVLSVLTANYSVAFAQNLPAKTRWEGTSVGINWILRLSEDSLTREKKAELDVPQQGAIGLKADILALNKDSIRLFFPIVNSTYTAAFNADKTALSGNWKQGSANVPLALKRVANKADIRRPQMPKPPFPYLEENVIYYNKDKSLQYGATLTIPKSTKPVPAVILITGSGPEDRDETLFGHKLFWVIADHLSRNGIAVLRVDDRGIGQSTGDISGGTSADFAKDVLAGIDYLKNHKGIDTKNIGLLGHSEGGVIAPLVAVQSTDVAFIVSLAGLGVKGSDLLSRQHSDYYKMVGFTDDEISKMRNLDERITKVIIESKSDDELKKEFNKMLRDWMNRQTEDFLKKSGFAGPRAVDNINQIAANCFAPWTRYFLAYDPATTLSKITIPVLALNGSKDVQVSADENLAGFNTLLTRAGNKNFKTVLMPGLNHMFQHAKTGAVSEYGEIEETISPEVLDIITTWIKGLKLRK